MEHKMIDISTISPTGLDLLMGEDGVIDAEALKGMSGSALQFFMDRIKAPNWYKSELINDWREANGINDAWHGPGAGEFDYERAILTEQERT